MKLFDYEGTKNNFKNKCIFAERLIVVIGLLFFLIYMVSAQVEHKIMFRSSACDLCEENTNRICSAPDQLDPTKDFKTLDIKIDEGGE